MNPAVFNQWQADRALRASYRKPLIMGVLNLTPDSFFDGGWYVHNDVALQHAKAMISAGVDIIDLGGESTRPGSQGVSVDEELSRALPIIEGIRAESDVMISIDTWKPTVMREAVMAGATMINDINGLRAAGALSEASRLNVSICLMHMQGQPDNMQDDPYYPEGIVTELNRFFEERIKACQDAGISKEQLILDPGFGFGKTVNHNLSLLKSLNKLHSHGLPLMLGVSRKSTLGAVLGTKEMGPRLNAGLSVAVYAAMNGVDMIRTHDVSETKQALDMLDAIINVHMEELAVSDSDKEL